MSFGAPAWFWAFTALPLLVALFFANERRRTGLLGRLVAARLAARLAGNVSLGKRRLRFLLLLLGLAALIIALAQPRYGFTWEQTKRKGRDVIVAVDTSRSMLANDLAPNRLTRAKLAAQDLLAEMQGDRVGVIAFAGTAFLQAPLTIDYAAVRNALQELDTEIIPEGGSNLAAMIRTAREAFGKGESDNRALIIFSDGEELDTDGTIAATELKGELRIFTVGLGSPDGALIPLPGRAGRTEFVKDDNGQVVKSRLDEDRLRKIAESTGGFYVRLETGRPEMKQIVTEGLGKMTEQEIDARLSRQPIERYQWPLSAALALLAGSLLVRERRRGPSLRPAVAALILGVLGVLGGPMAVNADAKNRGVEAYERNDFPGALREFSNQLKLQPESSELHFNRGSAAYKTGDLDQALSAFSKAVTSPAPKVRARAAYNMGNTLFQRGVKQEKKEAKIQEWKNALEQYEEALKVDPKDADTIYNRDLVRRLLEELEKEPPKEDQKDQSKQDQDQQDKDQKKNQDQQKNDQQKKDQQKQDQQPGGQDQKKEQNQNGKGQDQQPQDGKGKSEPQKPEASQDKQGDGQQDQKPNESGNKEGPKGEQQPPAQNETGEKPDKNGKSQPQSGDSKNSPKPGEKPEPLPDQPSGKKEGDLKPAQPAGGGSPEDAQNQEAAEAAAAAEGKMTEQQAKALLDSLKGEDEKVRLVEPQKRQKRTLRDW